MRFVDKWSEERADEAKRLYLAGHSAAAVAKMIGGVTRNAVLGKLHRMGVLRRDQPAVPGSSPFYRGAAQVRIARARAAAAVPLAERTHKITNPLGPKLVEKVTAPRPLAPEMVFEPLPGSKPRPWETRKSGECNWPVGHGLSCCEPEDAFGWCKTHRATGRTKPPPGLMRLARRVA